MRVTCTNCGGAHTPWDCKRPAKKSTAPKIEILGHGNVGGAQTTLSNAGEPMKDSGQAYNTPADDAPPVDTNSGSEAQVEERRSPKPEVASSILATLASAGSSNGRTAPFDGVNTGSSPVPASIQKRPRGRPKSITDMKTYKAAKQREYRAKWKGRK